MMRFEIDTALFGVAEAWRHSSRGSAGAARSAKFGEAQKLVELNARQGKAGH